MSSKKAGITGVAGRYAVAVFELADEEGCLLQVASDLRGLSVLFVESAVFQRFVASPVLSREDQVRGIAVVGKMLGLSLLTQRFLGIIVANRRLFALPAVIATFLAKFAEYKGEIRAEVTAAQPLSAVQQAAIKMTLEAATDRKKVLFNVKVEPALLGGMVVKLGSQMLDSSLRTKLQRLQHLMKEVE